MIKIELMSTVKSEWLVPFKGVDITIFPVSSGFGPLGSHSMHIFMNLYRVSFSRISEGRNKFSLVTKFGSQTLNQTNRLRPIRIWIIFQGARQTTQNSEVPVIYRTLTYNHSPSPSANMSPSPRIQALITSYDSHHYQAR
jgi:hypothetical protein